MKAVKVICILLVLIIVIGVCSFFPAVKDMTYKQLYPVKYEDIVKAEAERYGIPESLVYGVIRTESGFDPDAQSHADAMGLMQMTEDTFQWMQDVLGESYETNMLFEPEINIKYGCALLRRLIDYFGNTNTALSAYNAGIGNVSSWLENSDYSSDGETLERVPFEETENYVIKVNDAASVYRELYSMA